MKTKPRMTRQKRLVHEALQNENNFLSVQALHDILASSGSSIGVSTVYRTVQAMAEEGLLDSLTLGGTKTLYRLCVTDKHHHHLVCTNCGASVEFDSPEIEKITHNIAEKNGFTDVQHTIEVFGLCADCTA